jgi:hypothetical protein
LDDKGEKWVPRSLSPARRSAFVNSLFVRYFAAVIGFGFVAVWVSVGVGAALLCLIGSAVFSVGSAVTQRRRVDAFTNRFVERSRTMRTAPERQRPRTRPGRQVPRSAPARAQGPGAAAVSAGDPEHVLSASAQYGW